MSMRELGERVEALEQAFQDFIAGARELEAALKKMLAHQKQIDLTIIVMLERLDPKGFAAAKAAVADDNRRKDYAN